MILQYFHKTIFCSYLANLCESLQEFLTQHLATSVNSMLATAQVIITILYL